MLTPWESPTRNRLLTGSWKCFLWHVPIQAGDSPVGTLGQILDRIPECPKQAQGFLDNEPGRIHEQRWDQPNPGATGVVELSQQNEHSGMSCAG